MLVKCIHIVVVFLSIVIWSHQTKTIQLTGAAQGTTYNITYFADDEVISKAQVDSIFNHIDSSLSLYKPYSLIVQFNDNSRGVRVDEHLRRVVEMSLITTQQTNGLSDITVAPLTEAWGFAAKAFSSVPSDGDLKKILECVGSKYITLTRDSLIKDKPCVKIDANGIAQGYTVDVIARFFESKGLNSYLIEVGGELRIKGHKPSNTPFRIGIESPPADDFSTAPIQKTITLKDGAITTSGNYRRYHESNGKKHSHIIDPRTGMSVDNEMISVTVFGSDALTADAYDNALMLMGIKEAMTFVEQRPDLAAFFIYKNNDGSVSDTASSRFRNLILSNN